MAMHRIEKAVTKATGISQEGGEDRQAYFKRLIDAVWELSEEDWDKVGEQCPGAQEWANAVAEAHKAGKDGPEFDSPEFNEEEDDDMSEQTTADEKAPAKKASGKKAPSKKASGKKSPEKKASEKKASDKKAPAKKETGEGRQIKGTGVKVQIKKAILKNPSISVDDIMDRLGKSGDKPSRMTVAGIRAEFRHSLNVLKMEGLLDIDL